VPIIGERVSEPEPQALYVLVAQEEPSPGWVPGARSSVITDTAASLSGEEEVHVAIVPGQEDADGMLFRAPPHAFERAFDRGRPRLSWHGDLLTVAARLLGQSAHDLWFTTP